MTHEQFIRMNFQVLAETASAIFFIADGEKCCEINGEEFYCDSIEEFYDMVDLFGDENWEL